jgi:hypothetical protein
MDYKYDVFVSYRWVEPGMSWVQEQFVPALESAGLKVFLDVADFVPGRDLMLEMTRAGQESRRAVCVITPEYFDDNRMVGFESLMARRSDPSGSESRLIPLIFKQTELPEWVRGLIPVDWTIDKQQPREWKKLLRILGAPNIDSPLPGAPTVSLRTSVGPSLIRFVPKHSWERVNPAIIHEILLQTLVVCALSLAGRSLWDHPSLMGYLGLSIDNKNVRYALNRAVWFGLASFVASLFLWLGIMDNQFVLSLAKVLLFVSALGLFCAGACCVPAISYFVHRLLVVVFIVAGSAYFFLFGMARYYWKLRNYGDVAAEGLVFALFAYVMWMPLEMLFAR